MYEILFALLLIVTTIFLINNNSRKDRQKKVEQESIKIFLTLDELPKDVKTWVDMFEIIKDYWLINSMSTLSENNLKHWSDASYKNRIESFFKLSSMIGVKLLLFLFFLFLYQGIEFCCFVQ